MKSLVNYNNSLIEVKSKIEARIKFNNDVIYCINFIDMIHDRKSINDLEFTKSLLMDKYIMFDITNDNVTSDNFIIGYEQIMEKVKSITSSDILKLEPDDKSILDDIINTINIVINDPSFVIVTLNGLTFEQCMTITKRLGDIGQFDAQLRYIRIVRERFYNDFKDPYYYFIHNFIDHKFNIEIFNRYLNQLYFHACNDSVIKLIINIIKYKREDLLVHLMKSKTFSSNEHEEKMKDIKDINDNRFSVRWNDFLNDHHFSRNYKAFADWMTMLTIKLHANQMLTTDNIPLLQLIYTRKVELESLIEYRKDKWYEEGKYQIKVSEITLDSVLTEDERNVLQQLNSRY